MANTKPDNLRSSVREKVLEHRFVAALTTCLWRRGIHDVEVLRSEVDAFGHDIVIEANGIIRHIQLKTSAAKATTSRVDVNINLASKPSGCLIWSLFDPDTLELGPFRWFGTLPGLGLPNPGAKVGMHSRLGREGDRKERARTRVLNKGRFTTVDTIDEIADFLFGMPYDRQMTLLDRSRGVDDVPYLAEPWLSDVQSGNYEAILTDLKWSNSGCLAHLIDGYALCESLGLGDPHEFEGRQLEHAHATGTWLGGLAVLWTTLFLEHRRWRQSAPHEPDPQMERLLDLLCQQLANSVQTADNQIR